jgi:hypothetical protein
MSIVNRRNAVIGWATLTTIKRVAAMKAKRAAPARQGKAPKRKKKAVKVVAVVVAAGGALAFWKAKHRDATDYDSVASEDVRVGGDADAETTE